MLDEQELLRVRIEQGRGEEGERRRIDNQNWALRQHLLYHMLNYTLSPSAMIATADARNVSVETTMLFPMAEEPEHPPIPEPGSPWLPRGGEGMLGGHGQRLRVARAGSDDGAERGRIGIAWNGEKGVEVWDGSGWEPRGNESGLGHKGMKGVRWVRNGVVVGVDGVLDMPPSIGEFAACSWCKALSSGVRVIRRPEEPKLSTR